jgi:CRP-like cAMP-binding protein
MNREQKVEILRQVPFLAVLDDVTLSELADGARIRRYRSGQLVVSELEHGADVFVIARGQAVVSVDSQQGERQVLDRIEPGVAFGEMASLTGELRSATVRAVTDLDVLVIQDRAFDALRTRRPEVALVLIRILAERLKDSEQTLRALLANKSTASTAQNIHLKRLILSLWRTLVVNHQKDLAFITLIAFVGTLVLVRSAVFLSFALDFAPRQILRAAYMSGFGLVMVSACASLLTFRPAWRRVICLAYGIGSALIVNELGVTLAFDIFYKDIFTPDPNVAFDIERLYRRTEPLRATLVGLVLLLQAVYLRSFFARAAYLVRIKLRGLLRF